MQDDRPDQNQACGAAVRDGAQSRKAQFYVVQTALLQINGRSGAPGRLVGEDQAGGAGAPSAVLAPVVVVLVSTRWTRYLKEQMGLSGEPVFERAALPCEPDTHPNGHPFAWLYRDPALAVADERRLLAGQGEMGERSCRELEAAIRSAAESGAATGSEPPASAVVPGEAGLQAADLCGAAADAEERALPA